MLYLGDVHQTVLAGDNLDECAERHYRAYLALETSPTSGTVVMPFMRVTAASIDLLVGSEDVD